VVRVERSGDAVVAGRAAPGSKVQVTVDGKSIAETTADRHGEWVAIPDRPLPGGDHELALSATDKTGKESRSDKVVVVKVPGAEKKSSSASTEDGGKTSSEQSAGGEAGKAGGDKPLVVMMPRGGDGENVIMQGPPAGLTAGHLVLDSVTYDEEGHLSVSGRVTSGGRVFAYVDGAFSGNAIGSDEGRWAIASKKSVKEGLHRLRVDQVDADGKVLARVETPFVRSSMTDLSGKDRFVVVQPGNSLWRIARRAYGKGTRYTVIFHANKDQIGDPDLIYPGQIFKVPEGG
jgi:nucleoid-associated protein YgaU